MMNDAHRYLENLRSQDRDIQNKAYNELLTLTSEKVEWAYELWDELVQDLKHKDNHVRSIAAQVLCNLAAHSDPEGRIFRDFPALIQLTKDKRFVTARHGLQSLWKIGLAGDKQKQLMIEGLGERYRTAMEEKNGTLVRFDIVQGMRQLYDQDPDDTIKQLALEWIDAEEDPKYRKKYAAVWK